MTTSAQYYLGADLGGTSLRIGAVSPEGVPAQVLSVSTGRDFGPQDLIKESRALTERLARQLGVLQWLGVGFAAAGVVPEDGPLRHSDNLPKMMGQNLRRLLEESLGYPVAIENDARCFTLAEARFGAARGARNVCGLTLGTGIGCGLLIDGRVHRGVGFQAGEVCRLPLRGKTLEHFLSAAGLARGFRDAGGQADSIDGARLATLARGGDVAAMAAWQNFANDLALLCDIVIAVVEPEVIVIGGALAQAHDLLEPVLAERLRGNDTRVTYGALGPFAGVIGASGLADVKGSASPVEVANGPEAAR